MVISFRVSSNFSSISFVLTYSKLFALFFNLFLNDFLVCFWFLLGCVFDYSYVGFADPMHKLHDKYVGKTRHIHTENAQNIKEYVTQLRDQT